MSINSSASTDKSVMKQFIICDMQYHYQMYQKALCKGIKMSFVSDEGDLYHASDVGEVLKDADIHLSRYSELRKELNQLEVQTV